MLTLLKNGTVFSKSGFVKKDVFVFEGKVLEHQPLMSIDTIIDCTNKFIIPGFTDVHVHFREPGFSYKGTIKDGSDAALAGGYTRVCTMPNLNPAPGNLDNLKQQLDIIEKDAKVKIVPYATITQKGNGRSDLVDMSSLKDYVCAFSDDGKGIQSEELMYQAMLKAKENDVMIVAHCEDESLLHGGYIHDGEYAQTHGHLGICSESEWGQVKRDLALADKTKVKYHVCHISTKETVDLIRQAKKAGIDVSSETAPHYLVLSDKDLKEEGRFKMNPPLRSLEDQKALLDGIKDGTIDMIATDHAPHSVEEKSRGLKNSPFGIVGLETSFAIMNTYLVNEGIISLMDLVNLMSIKPNLRFGFKANYLNEGDDADITILDLDKEWVIDSKAFKSKGKATPFEGYKVKGKVWMTIIDGEIVYKED